MGITYHPTIVSNGLVLCLDAANPRSLGPAWYDLSKSQYSGVPSGTYAVSSGSYVFSDPSMVYISNASNMQLYDMTVSLWMKPSVQIRTIATVLDYDHATSLQGWVVQSQDAITNRFYSFGYRTLSGVWVPATSGQASGIQITNNLWQNLTFTKSGFTVVGYLNGIQVMSYTSLYSGIFYDTSRSLSIGNWVSNNGRQFLGSISNVLVYNRPLSSREVYQNYNALKGRYQ